jgi:NADH-quinone oxidoreductase subunit J
MHTVIFAILALTTIFGALMVVTRRNPINSILYLVLAFFALAALYVMLGATFLAVIQVIVYAGAIMVLFLFVVMMLNLREPEELEGRPGVWQWMGAVVAIGVGLLFLGYIGRDPAAAGPPFDPGVQSFAIGSAEHLGRMLFTEYVMVVQVAAILLLAAVVGAVALAKKKRV